MPAVPFIANIPQYIEDSNNGHTYLVDALEVMAIAYTDKDGALKCVDINSVKFKGEDITKFIYYLLPEKWEELKREAASRYVTPKNVTS